MELWRHELLGALQKRNRAERTVFEEIIVTNARNQDQVEVLRQENTQLTVQNEKLRQENLDLRLHTPASGDSSDIQRKFYQIQEEYNTLLKKQNDHAQQNIELRNSVEYKDKQITEKNAKIKELQETVESLINDKRRLQEEDEQLRKNSQTIMDEHAALQLLHETLETKNKKVETEFHELLGRFIQLKAEHAANMNEENEQYMRRKREQMQKQLEEAAKEEVEIAVEENGPPAPSYSMVPQRFICKFDVNDGEVNAVEWCTSSKMLVTGGADRKVRVWDFNGQSATLKTTLTGCNKGISSIAIDADDNLLLAASNDMGARIWSLSDQRLRHTLTGHSNKVSSAKFFNGNQNVVTCSLDRTLKLWDLKKVCCMKTLFVGSTGTDVIVSDYSATNIISSHYDKKIRFWDLRSSTSSSTDVVLGGKVTSLDLSIDRFSILCCVRDDTLQIIDVRANQVRSAFCHEDFRVGCDFTRARFSSDGTHVVVGGADGSIFVWNTLTNQLEAKLKELSSAILCTSWSLSGDYVASGDRDRKVSVWGP